LDPFLVLGAIAMISGWCITLGSIWYVGARTMKRVDTIEKAAMPLMEKASKALDETTPIMAKVSTALDTLPDLGNIDAIPATMVAGIEKVLTEQLQIPGSPLRKFTAEILNQTTAMIDQRIETFRGTFGKILPAASSILSKAGVEGKADKAEGRKAVAEMIEQFQIPKGLVERFVPASKREDPIEFLGYLAGIKQKLSAFAPGVGSMLDGVIEQAMMGGELIGASPGSNPLVRMLPAAGAGTGSTNASADYMTG